jgi:LPS export ABC transporter protein LptC
MKKYISIAIFLTLVIIATKLLDDESDSSSTDSLHYFQTDYSMHDVNATFYNAQGKKVYKIKAQDIEHVSDTETTNFHQITMEIMRPKGNIDAISDFATAPSKSLLKFPNRVSMIAEDQTSGEISEMETSDLTVNVSIQKITSPQLVHLETSSGSSINQISGRGLIVDLKNQTTQILNDVSSQIIIKNKDNDD